MTRDSGQRCSPVPPTQGETKAPAAALPASGAEGERVQRLWFLRLVRFGWFTEVYDVTAAGVAALARNTPVLFARAA